MAAVKRLSSLKPGQQATVYTLVESLQGFTRRRLLDLGMTPGARVTAEMPSMFRDPVAYRVRGTLIALRREQADLVLIKDQTS
ncbi:MAG: ferrous iron transport protein A [Chloroflexi bacterium]|nr:ferrous iron transport protein A [Chloroflexota bacterium]